MNPPPSVPGIDLNREQACLVSRKSELLWCSPGWWPDGIVGPEHQRMLGYGWHEFIHQEDLARMKRGFAQDLPRLVIFRCMLPAFHCHAKFIHYKTPYGPHWLTLGKSEVIPVVLPTMPCDFYLDEDTGTEWHK